MSDVQQINNEKKSPSDVAAGKLKEALAKEINTKVESQLKKTVDSYKIFLKEKNVLTDIVAETDSDKRDLTEMLKELL